MSLWYYIGHVTKVFESIERKFTVPAHSYLVCDRDFGVIGQKTKKTLAVFDPESWFNLVESAEWKKPIQVVRMTQEKHFVSISQFTDTLNFRNKDVRCQPVHLHKAARIMLSREHP
jgi:hypothetical protein